MFAPHLVLNKISLEIKPQNVTIKVIPGKEAKNRKRKSLINSERGTI